MRQLQKFDLGPRLDSKLIAQHLDQTMYLQIVQILRRLLLLHQVTAKWLTIRNRVWLQVLEQNQKFLWHSKQDQAGQFRLPNYGLQGELGRS